MSKSGLAEARRMVDRMMKEAQKPDSEVTFDDKLKLVQVAIKLSAQERIERTGGMGGGFDDLGPSGEGEL